MKAVKPVFSLSERSVTEPFLDSALPLSIGVTEALKVFDGKLQQLPDTDTRSFHEVDRRHFPAPGRFPRSFLTRNIQLEVSHSKAPEPVGHVSTGKGNPHIVVKQKLMSLMEMVARDGF